MKRKPILLDLYCGAGGCGEGFSQAGFSVIGVDINRQTSYPFMFHQQDALEALTELRDTGEFRGLQIDGVHMSPPCQKFTDFHRSKHSRFPDLIGLSRNLVMQTGLPYVIENVDGAPVLYPIMLCGTMFPSLRVIRHRLFESNIPLEAPPHIERGEHPPVYRIDRTKYEMDEMQDFVQVTGGGNCSKVAAASAMGIHWMTKAELNEAIPPPYTRYIGQQIVDVCRSGVHKWLQRCYKKRGACDECGIEGLTDWASISGEYKRKRSDYRELCRGCHMGRRKGVVLPKTNGHVPNRGRKLVLS